MSETPARPVSAQARIGATSKHNLADGPKPVNRSSYRKRLLAPGGQPLATSSATSGGASRPVSSASSQFADPAAGGAVPSHGRRSGAGASSTAAHGYLAAAPTSGRSLFGDATDDSQGDDSSLGSMSHPAKENAKRHSPPMAGMGGVPSAHHQHQPPLQPMGMRGTTTTTTRHPSPLDHRMVQQPHMPPPPPQPQPGAADAPEFKHARATKVHRDGSGGRSPPTPHQRHADEDDDDSGEDDSPSARRTSRFVNVDSALNGLPQPAAPRNGSVGYASTANLSSVERNFHGLRLGSQSTDRLGVSRSQSEAPHYHQQPALSGASPYSGRRFGRRGGPPGTDGFQHHEPSLPMSDSGYSAVPMYCDRTQDTTVSEAVHRRYLSDYHEVRDLGSGNFGQVALCRERSTGALVAVKRLGPFYSEYDAKLFVKERTILTHIRESSPHIMSLLGTWTESHGSTNNGTNTISSHQAASGRPSVTNTNEGRPSYGSTRTSTASVARGLHTQSQQPASGGGGANVNVAHDPGVASVHGIGYLVSPYYPNGTVADLLEYRRSHKLAWSDSEVAAFIGEMALALHALHSRSIAHVDFKPENILIDAPLNYVLADFGLAQFIDPTTGRPAGGGVSGPIVRRTRESLPRGAMLGGQQQQHHHPHAALSHHSVAGSTRMSQRADKQLFMSVESQDNNSFAALGATSNAHHAAGGFSVGHVGPVPAGFGNERSASIAYSVNTMQSQDEGDCRYVSEDMINRKQHYMAGDLFALGVSVFELLTSIPAPKNGPVHFALRSGDREQLMAQCPELRSRSEPLRELLFALLSPDPERVPSAFDVLRHHALMSTAAQAMDAAANAMTPLPATQWLPQARVRPEAALVSDMAPGGPGGMCTPLNGTTVVGAPYNQRGGGTTSPTLDDTTAGIFGFSPDAASYGAPSAVGDAVTPGSRHDGSSSNDGGASLSPINGRASGGPPQYASTPPVAEPAPCTPQNTVGGGFDSNGDSDSPISPATMMRDGGGQPWQVDRESDRRSAALHSVMTAGTFATVRLCKVQLAVAMAILQTQQCLVAPAVSSPHNTVGSPPC